MNVLWISGSPLPIFAKEINCPGGGSLWLVSLSQKIRKALKDDEKFTIICAVPSVEFECTRIIDNIEYIGVYSSNGLPYETYFTGKVVDIINNFNPGVIHIWGTEGEFSYAGFKAVEKCGLKKNTVISIQGLVSVIPKHYYTGIPLKYIYGYSMVELKRRDNIFIQRKSFIKRGEYEKYIISNAINVIGRTDWDYTNSLFINPEIKYFHCNESLRKPFYENKWQIENCKRHTIFLSSSAYSIKGFHMMLEALGILKKFFPDVHAYVPGKDRLTASFSERIRFNGYDNYLLSLIKKYDLADNVTFLGHLDEEEMCKQYLAANVFVSSSSIENSSNAICESMILGTPVVASCVGGIQSLMTHEREGFLYSVDAPYMLAHYIKKIFENDSLAKELSENSRKRAFVTHNLDTICERTIEIYNEMIGATIND